MNGAKGSKRVVEKAFLVHVSASRCSDMISHFFTECDLQEPIFFSTYGGNSCEPFVYIEKHEGVHKIDKKEVALRHFGSVGRYCRSKNVVFLHRGRISQACFTLYKCSVPVRTNTYIETQQSLKCFGL